jgi:hypothetical protein
MELRGSASFSSKERCRSQTMLSAAASSLAAEAAACCCSVVDARDRCSMLYCCDNRCSRRSLVACCGDALVGEALDDDCDAPTPKTKAPRLAFSLAVVASSG